MAYWDLHYPYRHVRAGGVGAIAVRVPRAAPGVISIPGPVLGLPPPGLFPEPAKLGMLVSPALSLDLQPMPTIPNRAAQSYSLDIQFSTH